MKKTNPKEIGISRRSWLKKSGVILTPYILGLGACVGTKRKTFDADVLIIGAGLSGLQAALTLEGAGVKVKVIEATNRFGGRVYTAKESNVPGHPELGANGIGGGYARLLDAAQKYNIEIGPMRPRTEPRKGEILYGIKNELIIPEKWAMHSTNPFTEDLKKGAPSSAAWSIYSKLNPLPKNDLTAWQNSNYSQWDRSVYEVLKENGFSEDAIQLTVNTNSSYGVDAKNISVLMFFQILNFISNQSAFRGKGGAAIGGNQRIPEAMGNAVQGDILLESPIKAIASEQDGVTVHLNNDKQFRAPYAIVTLPTSALKHVQITPTPKGAQQKAFSGLSYTPCVQIHYVPTRNYWEEDGLPPSMWTDQLGGRFMALKNDPDNSDKVTSCVAYLNSNVAINVDKLGEKEAIAAVTKSLEEMRPSLKGALKPVYYWTWITNKYAGGAYAYWKPGQITEFSKNIAAPIGRIHFAGEHTAKLMRGMEGAMESGERAAFEVVGLL